MRISDWSSDVCSSDLRNPSGGLSDRECDDAAERRDPRAHDAPQRDDAVAVRPGPVRTQPSVPDLGKHGVDFIAPAEGDNLMVLLLLALNSEVLQTHLVPPEAPPQPPVAHQPTPPPPPTPPP